MNDDQKVSLEEFIKEKEAAIELEKAKDLIERGIIDKEFVKDEPLFTARELALIENCKAYASGDAPGLPGHNLMIIISKFANADS